MKMICANCGIEFDWEPTIVNGKTYCCIGCSEGGPCTCDYGNLPRPDDHTVLVSISQESSKIMHIKEREHG